LVKRFAKLRLIRKRRIVRFIRLRVNGEPREVSVNDNETLLECLRERLGLTAAKQACGEGRCGACTVLLDGLPVNSCLVLAVEAEGAEILTLEGLRQGNRLHPLQQSFIREGAIQCGYCTPGMIMTAKALLDRVSNPEDEEIRKALAGNLCRCTGYEQIVRAIKAGAIMLASGRDDG
jgi:carbon-monoxide dehydrogenase small subunit